ncbi:hypothetical protein KC865_02025 [Candidatus Kaiserbacteria bacterium]|nr:hypothetical protein [Candidatus Kaiserbacteria bacterium]USN92232.1 MAG: hypothetical protein H6782_00180 [Candidatus Nomurabacteria bacterium]
MHEEKFEVRPQLGKPFVFNRQEMGLVWGIALAYDNASKAEKDDGLPVLSIFHSLMDIGEIDRKNFQPGDKVALAQSLDDLENRIRALPAKGVFKFYESRKVFVEDPSVLRINKLPKIGTEIDESLDIGLDREEEEVLPVVEPKSEIITDYSLEFTIPDLSDVATMQTKTNAKCVIAILSLVYQSIRDNKGQSLSRGMFTNNHVMHSPLSRFIKSKERLAINGTVGRWLASLYKVNQPLVSVNKDNGDILGVTEIGLRVLTSGKLPEGFESKKGPKKGKLVKAGATLDDIIRFKMEEIQELERTYKDLCGELVSLLKQKEEDLQKDAKQKMQIAESAQEEADRISRAVQSVASGRMFALSYGG